METNGDIILMVKLGKISAINTAPVDVGLQIGLVVIVFVKLFPTLTIVDILIADPLDSTSFLV